MASSRSKGTGANLGTIETQAHKRRKARQSPFEGYAARPSFDFADVSPATLTDGISHALTRGVAITFSLTADGGAIKVSIWLDNQKHQAYAADSETFNAMMESLVDVEEEAAD
jgi:hypothetical protein